MDPNRTHAVRRSSAPLVATRPPNALERAAALAHRALPAVAACASVACQSYAPAPLDPDAHRAAWHARVPDVESVRALAERLGDGERGDGAKTEFDLADGLGLREARLVALAYNPDLRVARRVVARALAGEAEAGRLDDPELSLTALRVSDDVPDPWVITPGLALTLPLGDRRGAAKDLAQARLEVARARTREAEWGVLHALERAWIAWSALRARVTETESAVATLEGLADACAELADRGELLRTEAALVRIEAARRRNALVGARGEAGAAEHEVRALLGVAPDVELALVPSLASVSARDRRTVGADALASNLALARLRDEHAAAEAGVRLEIERQTPDLTLGPLFESDEGQSRVGLLFGLPLPLWNANRRAIAEARGERDVARARCETEYERIVARLAVLDARLAARERQRVELEETLVPSVDRQLADVRALVGLGEAGALLVLQTLAQALDVRLDLIDARAACEALHADRAFELGPAAPGFVTSKESIR